MKFDLFASAKNLEEDIFPPSSLLFKTFLFLLLFLASEQ